MNHHHHHHEEEAALGPSATASVMTDIGGDRGAAVLYVPAELAGLEIEIRPVGACWDGTHTAVRERHVGSSVIWAAFFDSLVEGPYEVRVKGDFRRDLALRVEAGHVAEAMW
jgi:hypothetical protein